MLATMVTKSRNRKLGGCAATYAAQASCPGSCPFRDNGCYAEKGFVALTTRRLNGASGDATAIDVARAEAAAIDAAKPRWAGQPLRLHVVGDCPDNECAETVAAAARRWRERGGGPVWTYTHAWRDVDRLSWEGVSVLASVHSKDEAAEAEAHGYAAAMVGSHENGKRAWREDGTRYVPCPQQHGLADCRTCGLCFRDERLHERAVIVFEKH